MARYALFVYADYDERGGWHDLDRLGDDLAELEASIVSPQWVETPAEPAQWRTDSYTTSPSRLLVRRPDGDFWLEPDEPLWGTRVDEKPKPREPGDPIGLILVSAVEEWEAAGRPLPKWGAMRSTFFPSVEPGRRLEGESADTNAHIVDLEADPPAIVRYWHTTRWEDAEPDD